ncbi:MAG: DUF5606 domain-containing protein [Flavobacteriaceae bacterium]|jgi:hypothetical protein|nr:DUF5606 domain-containing protein [Flavobacteriaceae bacterium]MBT6128204.1 DUF5606 domain-containing protein [Flavobacteriaceae bacterium]MDG1027678.1 DUF5606 domain-containing protein [Flavobacteriaceae bacterium]MDG1940765.1 DUF5606 domain-containing protein [Flavobacteriaceae bacterium]
MSESNLDKVLTIAGKPGLFRMVAQTRTGVIAVSLVDQKKIVTNLGQQINVLSEIRVFGLKDEMPLNDIFERMFQLEKGQSARVKPKASKDELESYFFEVFQDYDEDRVYSSDIKKIIQWYNLLLDSNELKFKLPKEEKSSDTEEA